MHAIAEAQGRGCHISQPDTGTEQKADSAARLPVEAPLEFRAVDAQPLQPRSSLSMLPALADILLAMGVHGSLVQVWL